MHIYNNKQLSLMNQIDLALDVKKESETGLFNNPRLLLIKSGFISYYSKKPKDFIGNVRSLELSGQLPKMTISAADIDEIQQKDRTIIMKFKKSKLIQMETLTKMINNEQKEEDVNKAIKNDKKDDEIAQWYFKSKDVGMIQTFMNQVKAYKNNPQCKPSLSGFVSDFKSGLDSRKSMRQMSVGGFQKPGNNSRFSEIPSYSNNNSQKTRLSQLVLPASVDKKIENSAKNQLLNEGLVLESRDSIIFQSKGELDKYLQEEANSPQKQAKSPQKTDQLPSKIPIKTAFKKNKNLEGHPIKTEDIAKQKDTNTYSIPPKPEKKSWKTDVLQKSQEKNAESKYANLIEKAKNSPKEYDQFRISMQRQKQRKRTISNSSRRSSIQSIKSSQNGKETKVEVELNKAEEKPKNEVKVKDQVKKQKQSNNLKPWQKRNEDNEKNIALVKFTPQQIKKQEQQEQILKKSLQSPPQVPKIQNNKEQQIKKQQKIPKNIQEDNHSKNQQKKIQPLKEKKKHAQIHHDASASESQSNSGQNLMVIAQKMTEISHLLYTQAQKHLSKKKSPRKRTQYSKEKNRRGSLNISSIQKPDKSLESIIDHSFKELAEGQYGDSTQFFSHEKQQEPKQTYPHSSPEKQKQYSEKSQSLANMPLCQTDPIQQKNAEQNKKNSQPPHVHEQHRMKQHELPEIEEENENILDELNEPEQSPKELPHKISEQDQAKQSSEKSELQLQSPKKLAKSPTKNMLYNEKQQSDQNEEAFKQSDNAYKSNSQINFILGENDTRNNQQQLKNQQVDQANKRKQQEDGINSKENDHYKGKLIHSREQDDFQRKLQEQIYAKIAQQQQRQRKQEIQRIQQQQQQQQKRKNQRIKKMQQILNNIYEQTEQEIEIQNNDDSHFSEQKLDDTIRSRIRQKIQSCDDFMDQNIENEEDSNIKDVSRFSDFIDEMMEQFYTSKQDLRIAEKLQQMRNKRLSQSEIIRQNEELAKEHSSQNVLKVSKMCESVEGSQQAEHTQRNKKNSIFFKNKSQKSQSFEQSPLNSRAKQTRQKIFSEYHRHQKEEQQGEQQQNTYRPIIIKKVTSMVESLILQQSPTKKPSIQIKENQHFIIHPKQVVIQNKKISGNTPLKRSKASISKTEELEHEKHERLLLYLSKIQLWQLTKNKENSDLPQQILKQLEGEIEEGRKKSEAIRMYMVYILAKMQEKSLDFGLRERAKDIIIGQCLTSEQIQICVGPNIHKIRKVYQILNQTLPQIYKSESQHITLILPKLYTLSVNSSYEQAIAILHKKFQKVPNKNKHLLKKIIKIIHMCVDTLLELDIIEQYCYIHENISTRECFVYLDPLICSSLKDSEIVEAVHTSREINECCIEEIRWRFIRNEGWIDKMYRNIIPKYLGCGNQEDCQIGYCILKLKAVQLLIKDWIAMHSDILSAFHFLTNQQLHIKSITRDTFSEILTKICLFKIIEKKPQQSISICHRVLSFRYEIKNGQLLIQVIQPDSALVQQLLILFISQSEYKLNQIMNTDNIDDKIVDASQIDNLYNKISQILDHETQQLIKGTQICIRDCKALLTLLYTRYMTVIINKIPTEKSLKLKESISKKYDTLSKMIFEAEKYPSENLFTEIVIDFLNSIQYNNLYEHYLGEVQDILQKRYFQTGFAKIKHEIHIRQALVENQDSIYEQMWDDYLFYIQSELIKHNNSSLLISLLFTSETSQKEENKTNQFQNISKYSNEFKHLLNCFIILCRNYCYNCIKKAQELYTKIMKGNLKPEQKLIFMQKGITQLEPSIAKFIRKNYIAICEEECAMQ